MNACHAPLIIAIIASVAASIATAEIDDKKSVLTSATTISGAVSLTFVTRRKNGKLPRPAPVTPPCAAG